MKLINSLTTTWIFLKFKSIRFQFDCIFEMSWWFMMFFDMICNCFINWILNQTILFCRNFEIKHFKWFLIRMCFKCNSRIIFSVDHFQTIIFLNFVCIIKLVDLRSRKLIFFITYYQTLRKRMLLILAHNEWPPLTSNY